MRVRVVRRFVDLENNRTREVGEVYEVDKKRYETLVRAKVVVKEVSKDE